MQPYPSAILPHMEDILESRKQLRKCCNLDFFGLVYSRILINTFKVETDVNELPLFPKEMKCC